MIHQNKILKGNIPQNIVPILIKIIEVIYVNNVLKVGVCFYQFKKVLLTITSNSGLKLSLYDDDEEFKFLLDEKTLTKGKVKDRCSLFIDFYTLPKYKFLCKDAKRSLSVENAGGQSEISEMYSIDYFTQLYNAKHIILETEVNYWIDSKMVDFIAIIGTEKVGVSVARAMGFPSAKDFTYDNAKNLINKKILGLLVARNSVVKNTISTNQYYTFGAKI